MWRATDLEAKLRDDLADAHTSLDPESREAILRDIENVTHYAVKAASVLIRTPRGITLIEPHPDNPDHLVSVRYRPEEGAPSAFWLNRSGLNRLVDQLANRAGDPVDFHTLLFEEYLA